MDKNEYNNQKEKCEYLTGQDKPKNKVLDMGKFREELCKKKKPKIVVDERILKKFINHDSKLDWP